MLPGALAATALAAPESVLPPGLTLAVQDDHLPVEPEAGIPGRLDLLASTGVTVTRVDVLWNDLAPTRPRGAADPSAAAYRWSRYDAIVDGLTARGIAVIFNVYRSPSWANGGRGVEWAPNLQYYGEFMTALARRYDGRTPDRDGRVHGPVEMFEAWNEPNLPRFLMPQWRTGSAGATRPASPRTYARMLARASAVVKAVQPGAWIIGVSGGPNGSDNPPDGALGTVSFVRGLVPFHPAADAFAMHLYPATGPLDSTAMPSFRRLPELIGEFDRVRPGLPVLITEFGWTTSATSVRASHVGEAEQQAYLPQALEALAAIPRVRLAVWFNLQDNTEWTAGLRRIDGSAKPSWDVFTALPKFRPDPGLVAPPPPAPAPPVPPVAGAAQPAAPVPVVAPPPPSARLRCARLSAAVRATTAALRAARRALPPRARRAAAGRIRALTARRAAYLAARARSCRGPIARS